MNRNTQKSNKRLKTPKPNRRRTLNIKYDSWAFGTAKNSPFQISGNYQIALILIELN